MSKDCAVGALLGLAVGDAVGTTLEFQAPGTFEPITDMVGGGPLHLPAGAWTDDTSMALCLAESIIDTGGMDLADQLRRYVAWRRDGYLSSTGRCFDIGNTTSSQLRRFERTCEAIDPAPDQDSSTRQASTGRSAAWVVRLDSAERAAASPGSACQRIGTGARRMSEPLAGSAAR